MTRIVVIVGLSVAAAAVPVQAQTPGTCQRLESFALSQARVTQAQEVTSGVFTPPARTDGAQNGGTLKALPAFCRVLVNLTPSSDSDIKSEVWLPADWNGRLEMLGNGGWAGVISYNGLAEAIRSGYAATATDTGHVSNRAMFVVGHPEKLVDYGYRAVHETLLKAKTIVAAYYGDAPSHSYWNACSTGGGQGLMEAQRFPTDFDGIVAGAPGYNMFLMHVAWMANFFAVHETPANVIPAAKLPAINHAAIAACDALDGARDGLIEDPTRCNFNATSMICTGADGPDCLTPAQAASVNRIYGGAFTPRGKALILPGNERGSEFGWYFHSGETTPAQPARDTVGYAIYQDANWDWRTMDIDAALERSATADGGRVAATNPDLSAFFGRGGKLLMYHGWSDPNIPPRNTINYYNSVVEKIGGLDRTSGSMRLFMLPGMGHCGGGYGPNQFDHMEPISAWVEQGRAPDRIIARRESQGKVERTHPLCPYPQVAKYTGSGSVDDAANFVCTAPTTAR